MSIVVPPLGTDFWISGCITCLLFTLVFIVLHGAVLRIKSATWTTTLVAVSLIATLFCGAMGLLEWGYIRFHSPHALTMFAFISAAAIVAPVLVRFLRITSSERYRKLLFEAALYVAGLIVPLMGVFLFYLLRDLASSELNPASPFWSPLHYVSGGVALLHRRCKFVVCVDGEADPESTFQGHLTLVRQAQIDLGVQIEPRFDEMRPDPNSRTSRAHAQLFRIKYPPTIDNRPKGVGLLLYLKLSLTGDEAELLKRYRHLNPDFPHQSTLNQFYDEEQFEVYRQLGVHVAEGVFSQALLTENQRPATVRDWFAQLAENMLEP